MRVVRTLASHAPHVSATRAGHAIAHAPCGRETAVFVLDLRNGHRLQRRRSGTIPQRQAQGSKPNSQSV
ncbi:hypothetical protein EVAR_57793_1 [Eumeta japonica]|uniref:Uncharacterized protein n=1 Tax=Eumeta variegata TaxID=151549 RepID=A0A4C1Y9A9_EUMVA|nr:hypothetical protein EVAR_57793_1 [Eumeta japonica]